MPINDPFGGPNGAHYGAAIIGSSPLCLLEALHQRRLGKRVIIVEGTDRLGGAWKEISVFGLDRVEIAPHVMMFNKEAYRFLSCQMGVAMQAMTPQPVYVVETNWGRFRLAYHLSPFLSYLTVPFHYLTNANYRKRFAALREEYFGRFDAGLQQLWMWLFSKEKPRLQYPRGGTVELMDRMIKEVYEAGVEVRLNAPVQALVRLGGEESGELALDLCGTVVKAERVWMTEHQYLSAMRAGPLLHEVEYSQKEYWSLHLLLKTDEAMDISFVLMKGDPYVNLASDLSPYCQNLPEGKKVVVIRFHRWDEAKDREAVERFAARLRDQGLIPRSAVVEDFHFSAYSQGRIEKESLKALQAMGGEVLTIFASTNFSNSIGARVPEWMASLF